MNSRERKRQRLQEIRRIPTSATPASGSSNEGISTGGVIEVESYLAARQEQLRNIESALKSSGSAIGKRVFQCLPRYLRRRATSHNVRRLPIALRQHAVKEIDKPRPEGRPVFINRRQRRRKQLWNGRNPADVRVRRLRTHLWHAKRMKMIDIWGWRLALQPTEKCFRRLYKSSLRSCVIHDASYQQCVELSGETMDSLVACLTPFLAQTDLSMVERYGAAGNRMGHALFYAPNKYPWNCWGPVEFQWLLGTGNGCSIWLWLHPAFAKEASNALRERAEQRLLNFREIGEQLSKFELRGPRSNALLYQVLSLSTAAPFAPLNEQLWPRLCSLHSTACLPSGSVLQLHIRPPMENFPVKMPRREETTSGDNSNNGIIRADLQRLLAAPFPAVSDWARFHSQFSTAATSSTAAQTGKDLTVILQQGGSGQDAGWNLILPTSHARTMWISLIFAGAKARGLRELQCSAFEALRPCFPADYPDTEAYRAYVDQFIAGERMRKHLRLPPAKRPNYEQMGVQSPFSAPFPREMFIIRDSGLLTSLDRHFSPTAAQVKSDEVIAELQQTITRHAADGWEAWVTVRVFVIGKGVPGIGTELYHVPTEQDQQRLETSLLKQEQTVPPSRKSATQDETTVINYSSKPPGQEPIGFITNGGASMRLGHGFGIGHLRATALCKLLEQTPPRQLKNLVLMHNIESTAMRPCFIQLIVD